MDKYIMEDYDDMLDDDPESYNISDDFYVDDWIDDEDIDDDDETTNSTPAEKPVPPKGLSPESAAAFIPPIQDEEEYILERVV